MSKTVLHNLIDLLKDSDTETIYNVLIKFIPDSKPLPDEDDAIAIGETEIAHSEITDLKSIEW